VTATQKTTNSTTVVSYPIISALVAAETELGANREWNAVNDTQQTFLDTTFITSRDEVSSIPEIESTSSRSHEVINNFLQERGFSIKLRPFTRPDDFGVASVLKLALQWLVKGVVSVIYRHGHSGVDEFPAVRMGTQGVDFYSSPGHNHPVVLIQTQSGDQVGLTMVDEALSQEELSSKATAIFRNLRASQEQFAGVTFPMIDLDQQPDISWLTGMNTMGKDGKAGIVSQALQQTKFSMDELGAQVQSGVAIAMSRGMGGPKHHTIDKPFICVVDRGDLKQFIFAGYLAEDCWKKPAR
jgi:hypothetical protein